MGEVIDALSTLPPHIIIANQRRLIANLLLEKAAAARERDYAWELLRLLSYEGEG